MRSSIEFYASGSTISQIKDKVLAEWRRIKEDALAVLPQSMEVRMVSSAENETTYMAYVVIKTKIED